MLPTKERDCKNVKLLENWLMIWWEDKGMKVKVKGKRWFIRISIGERANKNYILKN